MERRASQSPLGRLRIVPSPLARFFLAILNPPYAFSPARQTPPHSLGRSTRPKKGPEPCRAPARLVVLLLLSESGPSQPRQAVLERPRLRRRGRDEDQISGR